MFAFIPLSIIMFRNTELRYKWLQKKNVGIPERFFDNHYTGRVRTPQYIILLLTVLMVFSSLPALEAKTASNTYVVVGTGIIYKENITAARQQAIANSLVSAVGLVSADLLSVDVLITNYEKLNEILYDRTNKFIQGYRVLTESAFGNQYRVMVQATVSRSSVKNKLTRAGILQAQKRMPRVLFFIAQQDLESDAPIFWWGSGMSFTKPVAEQVMAETMRERGFRIIEHGRRVQSMAHKALADSPDITGEEAINIGKALNADVVVIGRAIADNATNTMGSGLRSFMGTIDTLAFRTKTGDQIASVARNAVTANMDDVAGGRDALRGAASLTGDELGNQIAAAWQKEGLEADKIEIQLTGTKNLANFVMFRRMLNTIKGVEGVQVKELKADHATLNVDYKGKTRKLADALMLNAFETFGINIYEVAEDSLKIQLISSTPSAERAQ